MQSYNHPRVSIISVNYNGLEDTLELLRSLKSQSYQNTEVIIVDNASEFNPKNTIENEFPEAKVIINNCNLGFAAANNVGIENSTGPLVMFINNDVTVEIDTLIHLVEIILSDNTYAGVSPIIWSNFPDQEIEYTGVTKINKYTGRNKPIFSDSDHSPYATASLHGAAMLMRRSVLKDVGYWDESYFLYYEEYDLANKISHLGKKMMVVPEAKVNHNTSNSVGVDSALKHFFITRNRMKYMKKNNKPTYGIFWLYFTFVGMPYGVFKQLRRGKWHLASSIIRGYVAAIFSKTKLELKYLERNKWV